jgi:chemotaxis methyl-accepting protein methylase
MGWEVGGDNLSYGRYGEKFVFLGVQGCLKMDQMTHESTKAWLRICFTKEQNSRYNYKDTVLSNVWWAWGNRVTSNKRHLK